MTRQYAVAGSSRQGKCRCFRVTRARSMPHHATMKSLLRTVLTAALPALLHVPAGTAGGPNLLLILTDDHGWGDVACFSGRDVRTPHLDRLAAGGMRFTRMRANCTVCSPSRAAILTGRYADRAGVPGVIRTRPEDSWGWFAPSVPTLADELRRAGYHTAIVGKWHLGLESPNTPNERGFDLFHGFLGDMMDSYTTHLRHGNNYMRRDRATVDPQGHATDIFTDWASDYLRARAAEPARPFFLYLAYNAPHFPIEPPAEWLDRVRARAPDMDPKRSLNVAFVEHLDDRIGRVLDTLASTGLATNTVVVFTCDNGGSLPHGQRNDPWRGGKQDHYDGGLRVPFIVRWPGHVAPGSESDLAGLSFDVFPTFLDLAGAPVPAGLDAVSFAPLLLGRTMPAAPRDLYFVRREGGSLYGGRSYEALIRGDWKLMQNTPYSPLELYNLKDDPGETTNLVATQKKIVNEMSAALREHIRAGGATAWQPPAAAAR
jgi:arylsulfatase A-like enzyme